MMKRLITASAFLALASCGSGGNPNSDQSGIDGGTANINQDGTDKTVVPDFNGVQLLTSPAELWPCVEPVYRQLIFMEDTAEFYYCSAKTSKWTKVDVKGKDGKDGKNGLDGEDGEDGQNGAKGETLVIQGINGRDGRDGKDGDDGVNGMNGDDGADGAAGAAAPDSSVFVHPVNGSRWILGASFLAPTYSYTTIAPDGRIMTPADPNSFCPTGARLPTENELMDIVKTGFAKKLIVQIFFVGFGEVIRITGDNTYYYTRTLVPGAVDAPHQDLTAWNGTLTALCVIN